MCSWSLEAKAYALLSEAHDSWVDQSLRLTMPSFGFDDAQLTTSQAPWRRLSLQAFFRRAPDFLRFLAEPPNIAFHPRRFVVSLSLEAKSKAVAFKTPQRHSAVAVSRSASCLWLA